MSSRHNHEELVELLAPYAINAVDDEERAEIDAFLREHPEHQGEVDEYRAAAALLAAGHVGAPPSVWERIQNNIEPSAPPLRLVDEHQSAARATRRYKWISGVMSAAAVALVVTLGAVLANERSDTTSVEELAAEAKLSQGARQIRMMSSDQAHSASVVMTADGHGFLENGNLPELPEDKTYQLWAFTQSGEPVSVAVLGRSLSEAAFMAVAQVNTFAITIESSGGAVSPSGFPLVSATLPA